MHDWTAQIAVKEPNVLGEGPVWDEVQQRLWWVDIYGKRLLRYNPADGSHKSYDVPDVAGMVVLGDDERPLLAQGCHLCTFEPNATLSRFADVDPHVELHRLNDGKCDPMGRLWVGSMVEKGNPGGASLFCVNARGEVNTLLTGATISNGMAWADGGKLFYYIDTPTQQVVAFDCDLTQPTLRNRRVVFEFPPEMGSPDGMTIDEDGQLWIALFGGRSVVRLDPKRGQLTGRVRVGSKNVTSCAFGGPDLNVLYITTARLATSPEELVQVPDAGALFEVKLPVRGFGAPRFRRASP